MVRRVPAVRFVLLAGTILTLIACNSAPAVPVAQLPTPTAPPATATTEPTATPAPTATTAPTATSAPTATAVPVGTATNERSFTRGAITNRPWMVMIDNHPDAYPQSGMDRAAVVFEGLAEYGITRFVALYNDGDAPDIVEIGPVRSTRLYFAQWAMGFHPIYAHAGGSPDGVQLAETTDQFTNFEALNQPKYTWRDSRRGAPHNLYTNSTLLRAFAEDKAVRVFDDPTVGFLYESQPAAAQGQAFDYFFLDPSSRAGFSYDPASNMYRRTMRGRPHIDRVTGEQLRFENVVVMQVNEALRQGDDKQRIDQEVVGTGPARMFIAGRTIDGTWRKPSAAAPLRFYDIADQEVIFNTGAIWIAAIPTFERLTVQ
jgi:hypothetical protein